MLLDVGAEVFEMRRIVSHIPGLDEIEHGISLARPVSTGGPPDLMGLGIDWMITVALFVASLPGAVGRITAFGPERTS